MKKADIIAIIVVAAGIIASMAGAYLHHVKAPLKPEVPSQTVIPPEKPRPEIPEHPVQEMPSLLINGVKLYIEIALSQEERAKGLMHRTKLEDNFGMIFVYPQERLLSFWMKNTKIPLSIAFINAKGIIVDIQDMEPQTTESHKSKAPASYGLEVNQGWFAKHNIKIGDTVSNLPFTSASN